MKAIPTFLSSTILALALGCGGHDAADGTRPAPLRSNADLSQYQPCDLDTPCPEGLQCIVAGTPEGDTPALCLEPAEACALVDCGDDECVLLESYPAQVRCAGTCEGDDCDEPVSN